MFYYIVAGVVAYLWFNSDSRQHSGSEAYRDTYAPPTDRKHDRSSLAVKPNHLVGHDISYQTSFDVAQS